MNAAEVNEFMEQASGKRLPGLPAKQVDSPFWYSPSWWITGNARCLFLELPGEVRNRIYQYVLVDYRDPVDPYTLLMFGG